MTGKAWLARVRHDLCKRLLWPARDRQALGGSVQRGELVVALTDDEGRPTTALALWQTLRAAAPAGVPGAVLDGFSAAVGAAAEAAERDDLAGVLALDVALQTLARNVK
jgi:hypothetical protein